VFYVTSIVGAGILVVPGIVARSAGPASLVAWMALALASFPIALMFAEMSARRPNCAGIAALIRDVLDVRAGDTASLLLVIAYVLNDPAMAIASARYLCDLLGLQVGFVKPVAAGFILLAGAFCLASVATAAKLQGMVLIALIACLLAAVMLALPSMSASRLSPFAPHGWLAVGAALPAVFWAFLGWENVSMIAEEVRDPRRSFHRAIRIAVPLIGILYLVVIAAYLALPSKGSALLMPTLLLGGVGGPGRVLGDLFGLAVVVPTTNAWMLGASRLVLSTAREGLLPARLQRRSARAGAPTMALAALAIACVLVVAVLAALELDESFAISLAAAIFLTLYIAAAVATLRDRPTRTMRLSALATGLIAIFFLPFTGWERAGRPSNTRVRAGGARQSPGRHAGDRRIQRAPTIAHRGVTRRLDPDALGRRGVTRRLDPDALGRRGVTRRLDPDALGRRGVTRRFGRDAPRARRSASEPRAPRMALSPVTRWCPAELAIEIGSR
jgi:amino acid efflux transporter